MKKLGIGFLILAALLLEINLFITWLLPYMDYTGIGFIYIMALLCRCLIYALICTGYDYLWVKYLDHNTVAYRKGLIKLYKNQVYCENSPYMVTVFQKAILKLESGDNPTSVEEYVVRAEKQWKSL